MDLYYKTADSYTNVGFASLSGITSLPEIEILKGISHSQAGCRITFEPLSAEQYEQIACDITEKHPFGEESYIVKIEDNITIYYTSPLTRLYGLYAIKRNYTKHGIQKGIICNTPKVPFRCFRTYLPGRAMLQTFRRLVDMLIAFGHNSIMLEIGGAMEYKRHPEINEGWIEYCNILREYNGKTSAVVRTMEYPKNALHPENGEGEYLTYKELRDLVTYCRDRHFEIIPEVPTLSHTDYILFSHPDFAEYPDDLLPNNACPSNREYLKIEEDILDEIIEVFKPRRINICHDEAYVLGICPECRKKTASRLFGEHIIRLHDYLARQNIKTMIWGDGILPTEHGGNEAYHRRFPWDGKWTVTIRNKDYPVHRFQYYSASQWHKLREFEPSATAWYVPEKTCYKMLPRDIEVINWMWSLHEESDEILLKEGYTTVYGNFLAVSKNNLNSCIQKGIRGFAFSNWGGTDFEGLQRTNSFFGIGYNALAAWDPYYDEQQKTQNIFKVADAVYRYLNFEALSGKHIRIIHSTDAVIEHNFFHSGFRIMREDFHIGDYEITFSDGSVSTHPIYWGFNIGNENIGWDHTDENTDISANEGGSFTKYLFEPVGTTKYVMNHGKTFYEIVIPVNKEVQSVVLKANCNYHITYSVFA